MLAKAVFPKRGIVAGATSATSDLKLAMIDMLRELAVKHPQVTISTCIDDIGFDSAGRQNLTVINRLHAVSRDFKRECEKRGW
eukprot:10372516-Karenia_brevis.AAC.1